MEENLPPGFRFHPTDEELITYYLYNKVSDSDFTTRVIADVHFNKCEPWDLPARASMGEKEWYFFSRRDRKYPTGQRTNRATGAGYWKTTGKDREILSGGGGGVLVGKKKTLVFYTGRAPKGEKTGWVMHEYRLHHTEFINPTKEEWVVCRIFSKMMGSSTTKKLPRQTPSSPPPPPPSPPADTSNAAVPEVEDNNNIDFPMGATSSSSNIGHNCNYDVISKTTSWAKEAPFINPPPPPPPLSWPPQMGSFYNILPITNSLLLAALQLRGAAAAPADDYDCNFVPQGSSQLIFGNHDHIQNFHMAASSSTRPVPGSVPDPPAPEQLPNYNPDMIW